MVQVMRAVFPWMMVSRMVARAWVRMRVTALQVSSGRSMSSASIGS
jgi:hypothetical protein